MRKLLLLFFLLCASTASAQSPVTVTGLVTDAGNNPATSGTVTFNLIPSASSIHYFVSGVGTITQQVVCGIDGTGHVKSFANLATPCTVWGNDVINPANTQYRVTLAPNGLISNIVSGECITGTSYSLNNPVFCPIVQINPQATIVRANPFQTNIIPIAGNVFNVGSPFFTYAAGYFNNLFLNGSQFSTTNLAFLNVNNTFTGNNSFPGQNSFTSFNINNVRIVDGLLYPNVQAAVNALGGFHSGTVIVPPGTWPPAAPNTALTLANPDFGNIHIICAGIQSTFITYTGSSAIPAVIDIGTAADGSANKSNITIDGCTVSGNANVTNAIRARGVDHSSFRNLDLRNVTGAAFLCQYCVVNDYDNIHTSLNDAAFTTTPTTCFQLDGPDAGHKSTWSYVTGPICEGVSGTGILLGQAAGITIIGGTSEQNARGSNITVNALNTTYIGFDEEANSIEDILFNGTSLFLANGTDCGSAVKLHAGSTALNVSIQPNVSPCTATTIDVGAVGITNPTGTVASGTQAMNTALINALVCGAQVTITVGQAQVGDAVIITHATGGPASNNNGIMQLLGFVTVAGQIGLQWCNPTAGNITPTAETVTWRVVR